MGILDVMDPTAIPASPVWQNASATLAEKARIYLDFNCAHCHNPSGMAATEKLNLNYETSLEASGIPDRKETILNDMEEGRMPRIGTSVVHKEALEVIREYIHGL